MGDDSESMIQPKKKVTPGQLDVHPTENALVVNYYVQEKFLAEDGTPMLTEKKPMQKIIRVKAINKSSNLNALAKEIVEKCKLIHPNKIKDVEQTLYYLQRRQKASDSGGGFDPLNKSWMGGRGMDDGKPDYEDGARSVQDESSSMDNIEQYIEGLYEELPDKIASTRHILNLARIPDNMDALMSNDSLISAVTRVLREENKKSMELVTNIMYIFFCFSNFSRIHPFVTSNKVGDMCLRITDQELNRYNIWVQDLSKLEAKSAQNPDNIPLIEELDQEHRKFQAMIKKQDQLLFVCFHILLNLAEDINIEIKMVKRDIVRYLIILLDRKTPDVLLLALTFLKKLSIFKENKDDIISNMPDFLGKFHRLFPSENMGIQSLAMRLLLNLSHDQRFRVGLVHYGFLNKLGALLSSKVHTTMAMQLLYQISIDDFSRGAFTSSEIIPLIMKMILEFRGEKTNLELMALAINLAANRQNAELMCEENGLKFLMRRATKTKDPFLLKMLKNLASHDGDIKMLFLDHIDELMHMLLKTMASPEVFVEVLGIMGHLTIQDFDFTKLSDAYGLLELVQKRLAMAVTIAASEAAARKKEQSSGRVGVVSPVDSIKDKHGLHADDDITLEAVILLGTMSHDENIVPKIARMEIIALLIDLMIAKEEDDEIILQIIYCIYHFLLHESTRSILINQTQVVSYLIDLLYDRNVEIRKMCDVCLDIISEINDDWVRKIKQQKFQWHNSEYLSLLAQGVSAMRENMDSPDIMSGTSSRGIKKGRMAESDSEYDDSGYHPKVYGGMNRSDWPQGMTTDDDEDSDEEDYRRLVGGTSALLELE